ncbi:Glutathione synthetase ATP-binding protein [Glarea lozoyensis ATCC 20868]|uniref:Glutathione synthetase ATP-binding protein n=1 Tax=Glarea lozoyensis (strain ATCC 20868 / MF5171) TaxID=1116229 RepID=S3DPP3_GLAL2|nr:Glutathione synthetase ATP-binding protein [Glarea lozoyensis ATCC 20868]EPE28428.1 Glutathione synthetase ATP-binding protein [Glarea lozoyensis ATCC 20868]
MAGRNEFLIWENSPDTRAVFECEWQFIQRNGPHNFDNLYIALKSQTSDGEGTPAAAAAAGQGIYISEGYTSDSAYLLSPRKTPDFAAFIQQCTTQKSGLLVLQVPKASGYVVHSDPWKLRVADCALISCTRSFLLPLEKVEAYDHPIKNVEDIAKTLGAAVGAVGSTLSLSDGSVQQLEFQLERRLSFPWLSANEIQPRRLCVLTWNLTAAKRISWATANCLGIKVVAMSTGPWLETDKPPSEYMLDGYINCDVTPDASLWHRVVAAVKAYPDPIDGIVGPWDALLESTAKAAKHLGMFTPGPEPFAIATNKFLTRQLLDPKAESYFTVESVEELETRLKSGIPVDFPVVSKPVLGTWSFGVYKADNALELRDAVAQTLFLAKKNEDKRIIIESYVDGPEVDCNLVLLDGEILYSEIVDDFPCQADIAEDSVGALFTETQAAVPSGLPKSEQKTITEFIAAAVRQQGFNTGVFHCEARIRNSSVEYVFAKGATVPDLELKENSSGGQTSVFLHEVNARMPGPMSSAGSLVSRGIDLFALLFLCTAADWPRFKALSVPFSHDDVCDHVWLTNCIIPVKLKKVMPLFPGFTAEQIDHEAVDSQHSPLLALSKTHPELIENVVRHSVYIESAAKLAGKEGDFIWATCMVLRTPVSRSHARFLAQRIQQVYEAFVLENYN